VHALIGLIVCHTMLMHKKFLFIFYLQ
jgi:hypothetical protein